MLARIPLATTPSRVVFSAVTIASVLLTGCASSPTQSSLASPAGTVAVTVENFPRAETDLYFAGIVRDGGFGQFHHNRELTPIDRQTVIRMNRDTLYSAAVFDLDAGPVTITLPDAGKRFLSLQIFDEDQYTHGVVYEAGTTKLTKEKIGTRYTCAALRILLDPSDPQDVAQVHALQDAVRVEQKEKGRFEVPAWDHASQARVRDALIALGDTLPDKNHMFGSKEQVDPVRRLIGAASAWGGNPDKEAIYLNVQPEKNDGDTVYELTVKDVPVDAFWSISVYDAKGYYRENDEGSYTLNSITATKSADGSVTVRFGDCDGTVPNCLPISDGWNYMVRLYRPHREVLDGKWKFPEARPIR